ncbi:hypothetical protein KAX03_02440, partial [Candidatus Bathyarchaeota archaeon]|nr:hypothetical protein [Candidatus Bathyarchaeota archaeon]
YYLMRCSFGGTFNRGWVYLELQPSMSSDKQNFFPDKRKNIVPTITVERVISLEKAVNIHITRNN